MAKRIDWNKVMSQINNLREIMIDQNFCIDLAHKFNTNIQPNIIHRNDLRSNVISAYWAREFMEHNKLNSYDLNANMIFVEVEYYSYLNLIEFRDTAYRLNESLYVVDLISESTDPKSGMEIDDWFDENDYFQSAMQNLWDSEILSVWIRENKLVTRKNISNFSHYWKNEDYIYQMRVYDSSGKPKLVILLGTYIDYV